MEPFYILRADLSSRECQREEVPEALIRKFIGGKGLAAHYLATELPAAVDPLNPENPLIFMTGPASGVFPGTCRHTVVTKSPATGGFVDNYAGGYLAWELRKAGLLGIVITGKARKLSCLEVTREAAVIRDATDLAGRSIGEVDDDPRFRDFRVAAIGPAGERLVSIAAIGHNTGRSKRGRQAFNARGGAGAVMGSKNLKCVAVNGGKASASSPEARSLRSVLSDRNRARRNDAWMAAGTSVIVELSNAIGCLPTRNWSSGSFEGADAIGADAVVANLVSAETCYNCSLRCGKHVRVEEGAFPGAEAGKVEYETIALGAANTGNADFSSLVHFSHLCDELGLDSISAGAAVAFTMDCAERGIIEHPIRFGDSHGQAELVEAIAYRRGIGNDLADGVSAAAKAWGVDDTKVPVFEVKGLEYPGYDPRGSVGMALAYATAERGACHGPAFTIGIEAWSADPEASRYTAEGKAAFVVAQQDLKSALWSMVTCDSAGYHKDLPGTLAMLDALGLPMTEEEFRVVGARIWNLTRLFNVRQGRTTEEDSAPKATKNPLSDLGKGLDPETFASMKNDYYAIRKWDASGRPTPELLAELGLEEYRGASYPPPITG